MLLVLTLFHYDNNISFCAKIYRPNYDHIITLYKFWFLGPKTLDELVLLRVDTELAYRKKVVILVQSCQYKTKISDII